MKRFLLFPFLIFTFATAFPQKYVKVWSDEFNTPGLPDSTKWDYEVGKVRNNELQYYTYRRSENARIEDTVLIIEARKEPWAGANYTSASLISTYRGDWKYGKFEIRAKVPTGKGTWPAIWMMPTNSEYGGWPKSGEIDIMEYVGMNPSNLYFTAHFEGTNGTGHQSSGNYVSVDKPYDRFITFTLVWTPEKLEWYADGVKYHTYNKSADDPRVWPFDKMFYMILNLAYGGSWGAQQGIDDTKLPHKFYIDYVRVYQLQEGTGPFSLKVDSVAGGTTEVSPKLDSYPDGTMVTLTAYPEPGYEFDTWLYTGAANPMQLEMNRNITVSPVFKKKNEIITNGDFTFGAQHWAGLWFYDPANTAATSSVVDGVYVVDVTKPGTANWHIVDQQTGIPLIQGTTYQISFDAWAENPNSMDVFLSKNHDDYGGYYSTVKNITTNRQTFNWTVKMAYPTDMNCRFGFGFGKFTGKVYIDNVSMIKSAATGTSFFPAESPENFRIFPNPTSGTFEIAVNPKIQPPFDITLFNLNGQAVYKITNTKPGANTNFIQCYIPERSLENGVYLLRISNSGTSFTQKLVLK